MEIQCLLRFSELKQICVDFASPLLSVILTWLDAVGFLLVGLGFFLSSIEVYFCKS